jgi:hypothetical protein
MRYRITALGLLLVLIAVLAGCGGGGGSSTPSPSPTPPSELTGQFVDSAVGGLMYVTSSGIEGMTDADGTFKYKPGDTVKFYLGDILLGEATGDALLTPVSLVPGAVDETNATVQNIARFLQTLDDNSNPSDGINIPTTVFDAAAGMSIDFSASDFESTATTLLNDIFSEVGSTPPMLVTSSDAAIHLAGSLLCGRAGTYEGTYTGDADGNWSFEVDASGNISGSGKSITYPDDPTFNISGTVSSSGDSVVGSTSSAAEFSGTVSLDGTVSGEWHNTDGSASGTYSGSRTGGPSTPCAGSVGGGGGVPAGDYGSLSMAGQDAAGTVFAAQSSTASILGGGGSVVWVDYDVATTTSGIGRTLTMTFTTDGPASLALAVVNTDSSKTVVQQWHYVLICSAPADCAGIDLNTSTGVVALTSVVMQPSPSVASSPNSATGNITLNGTVSYTVP